MATPVRLLAMLAASLIAATLAVVASPPADAAEIDVEFFNFTITPDDPGPFELINTNFELCLPDGTAEGDTFTLTVDPQLTLLPVAFDITNLPDGAGAVVATANVTPDPAGGGTVVFTLTDYASTRTNVCGNAFFGARINEGDYGTEYTFTYTFNGGAEVVTITTRDDSNDFSEPVKFSRFTGDDQGTEVLEDAIRFGVNTPAGPYDVATITDNITPANGFEFNCASITYRRFTIDGDGNLVGAGAVTPISEVCSPTSIVAEVGPTPAETVIRLTVDADILDPDLEVYRNRVLVTIDDGDQEADSSSLRRVDGGGQADGADVSPEVDIVKLDDDGNDADTADDAADLGLEPGAADLVFTITNTGTEPLVDVDVTDAVIANGTITGLDCTFPDDSTGTTWAGPFAVDDSFGCTAQLSDVSAGEVHQDIATVTATGAISGTDVDDDNPYHAVSGTPTTPEVRILKGDVNGNEADTPDDAVNLGPAPGEIDLVFTITNTGTEPLVDVAVTDLVIANGTITDLVCLFPDDSLGTTWDGPFAPDDTFACSAMLDDVSAGEVHEDIATVTATGETSGTDVDDDNPYHAITSSTPAVPPPPGVPPSDAPPGTVIVPGRLVPDVPSSVGVPFIINSGAPLLGGVQSPARTMTGLALVLGATMALFMVSQRQRRRPTS